MPDFQTKPLIITIVSDNDSRIIPREKVYLGQTKRQFCTRLKEHQRAVSNFNSSKSALAEHVCETSNNITWEDSRIITTNNRYGQRLCLEAWHINASPCTFNRDDGSYLPQEYLHLAGR